MWNTTLFITAFTAIGSVAIGYAVYRRAHSPRSVTPHSAVVHTRATNAYTPPLPYHRGWHSLSTSLDDLSTEQQCRLIFSAKQQRHLLFIRWLVESGRLTDTMQGVEA